MISEFDQVTPHEPPPLLVVLQTPAFRNKGLGDLAGEDGGKAAIKFLSPACFYSSKVQQQAHVCPVYSFVVKEAGSAHLAAFTLPCKYQVQGSFVFAIIPASTNKVSKFLLCSCPCFHLLCSGPFPWSSVSSDKKPHQKNASFHGH